MLFLKKEKLPIKLFILGSFAALIMFAAILIFLNTGLPVNTSYGVDQYNFKNNINNDNTDPLVTRVPSLKDVLAGPIISDNDPSQGAKYAMVNIVIFSDSDCKFCREQEAVLKNILAAYPGVVRLIRKDFPDTKKTSLSWQLAIAGRCADMQEKFWPYHDLITTSAKKLNEEQLISYATDLKMDPKIFRTCINNESPSALINDNITEANTLEITGVPYTYVDDKEFFGQVSFEEIKTLIDSKLKK